MDIFKDIMKKKQDKPLDPTYKDAKMSVLKEIKKLAAEAMGDDLKGLKEVTVASDNPEGLEMGLEKAKELVGVEGEEAEAPEVADIDESELTEEEEALLEKLLAKKKSLV